MSKNLFEIAARNQYRFPSTRGALSVEDLWALRLEHRDPAIPTLDYVAKAINAALKASQEESFVHTKSTDTAVLEEKLEIVKHIIGVKLAEREAAMNAKIRAEQRQKIMTALENRENVELSAKSADELKKMLIDLEG